MVADFVGEVIDAEEFDDLLDVEVQKLKSDGLTFSAQTPTSCIVRLLIARASGSLPLAYFPSLLPWYLLGLEDLFHQRRPPTSPLSLFFAPYAVEYSKQRRYAMSISRKELEISVIVSQVLKNGRCIGFRKRWWEEVRCKGGWRNLLMKV